MTEKQSICILALNPEADVGISFGGVGDLLAPECVVWSNASGSRAFGFSGIGKAQAKRFCGVGGSDRSGLYEVSPEPEKGCPPARDPMASWKPPEVEPCDFQSGEEQTGGISVTLKPGVYCGGLRVTSLDIQLQKGVYIIKDGPLELNGINGVTGDEVGIYLTGDGATATIGGTARVALNAATRGPMAGVVIAQDPKAAPGQSSQVTGTVNLDINGILYFPTQRLSYWGVSNTSAASPSTTLVADSVEIGGDALLAVAPAAATLKIAPVTSQAYGRVVLER